MRCSLCGKESIFLSTHHKFSQTKVNLKLYGRDLINNPINLQTNVCIDCHSNKKNGLIVWSEQDFCKALGITPRSKTLGGFR
jgi:hypothetical protein